MRIRWTPAAANDLGPISDYLKEHHPNYRGPALPASNITRPLPPNDPGVSAACSDPGPYGIMAQGATASES